MKRKTIVLKHFIRIYHSIHALKRKRYINNLIKKGLKIGKDVEIISDFFFDPSHCFLISIGNNCTICPNVRLIAHDASTKKIFGYTKIGKITIEDNCFIGDSVIVLPNVTIGEGSIIGAGAVVTKDIPKQTIATGSPARAVYSIEEFKQKIKTKLISKKMFNKEYLIQNISSERREKLLYELRNGIGFIV